MLVPCSTKMNWCCQLMSQRVARTPIKSSQTGPIRERENASARRCNNMKFRSLCKIHQDSEVGRTSVRVTLNALRSPTMTALTHKQTTRFDFFSKEWRLHEARPKWHSWNYDLKSAAGPNPNCACERGRQEGKCLLDPQGFGLHLQWRCLLTTQ